MDITKLFLEHLRAHVKVEEQSIDEEGKIRACFTLEKKWIQRPARQQKKRWMILIGNGLCRAFDDENFHLDKIVGSLKKGCNFKKISSSLKLLETKGGLNIEDSLGVLYNLSHVRGDLVSDDGSDDVKVVLQNGESLRIPRPEKLKINEYFYALISQIKDASNSLYTNESFCSYVDKFLEFLKFYNEDIFLDLATLNYDTSLYRKLFSQEWVQKSYVDGFLRRRGTNEGDSQVTTKHDICRRILRYSRSRYLHLHGSYLFVKQSEGLFRKHRYGFFPGSSEEFLNSVIILTNQREKYRSIKYLDVLNEYNMSFGNSLDRCEKLIVFGYAGGDSYLQEAIKVRLANRSRKKPLELLVILRKKDSLEPWKKLLDDSEKFEKVSCPREFLYSSEKGRNRFLVVPNLTDFDWPINRDLSTI